MLKGVRDGLLGEKVPNPIGLAADLIKVQKFITLCLNLVMVVEVGTVTPKRQLGNPKPEFLD